MSNRMIALACIAVLGLAGCTTPDDRTPPSTSSSETTRPSAPRPKDRDEGAVLAALRRLDLCAVLDKAAARTPGIPAQAKPVARQPSRCDLDGMGNPVSAMVAGLNHNMRIKLLTRALGGAKAYLSVSPSSCDVYLPVSFEKAIELSQIPRGAPSNESCRVVTDLAAASAAVLGDPAAVQVAPRWDGCGALAEALGSDAGKAKLIGDGLDDCMALSRVPPTTWISFADDFLSAKARLQEATIGGKQVRVYEYEDGNCDIYWRQAPFDSPYAAEPDYQVRLSTFGCDRARTVARSLMSVLAKAPPDDVTPQRPLLYAPDDADDPYPGDCAYVEASGLNKCEPYVQTRVPSDPAEVAKAALSDAQVACAVALDAVGTHFGAGLRPVAVPYDGCYFVEPERRIQVRFAMSTGRTTGDTSSTEATVAGHPGFATSRASFLRYEVSTSPTLEGDGSLLLSVASGPVAAEGSPLPAGTDKKTKSVLADILRTFFS